MNLILSTAHRPANTIRHVYTACTSRLKLDGFTASTRKALIDKLYESIQYNTPWEMLGDTMVCRSLFYRYRSRLMYLVAVHMDMIDVSQSHDNT